LSQRWPRRNSRLPLQWVCRWALELLPRRTKGEALSTACIFNCKKNLNAVRLWSARAGGKKGKRAAERGEAQRASLPSPRALAFVYLFCILAENL
jgi:hypothetical protein